MVVVIVLSAVVAGVVSTFVTRCSSSSSQVSVTCTL